MTAPTEPLPTFGNYELIRLLAHGGMADIYLARQRGLGRLAAIKVLSAQRASEPESCALFLDEARLVGMLDHGNLASVFDVDSVDGVSYVAMEYVHGADLREVLARASACDREIPYDCALTIVMAAAAGLEYAHTRCDAYGRPLQLVHRDVSLSNIMVSHDGAVKLIDFGIAQSAASLHHTEPGVVRGKASYMSPEQCLGDRIDQRTDVFALGVVLYELTTGRRCFQGDSELNRMLAVVRGDWVPPSVHVSNFSHALERVIRTALSLDPAHRYATAAAMIEELEAVAALEGWTLGSHTTTRMMEELFGSATLVTPVLVTDADDDDMTYVGDVPDAPSMVEVHHAAPISTKRRLARGTETDLYEAAQLDDWQDEAPTRGRPSAPRMCRPRVAA